MAKVDLPGEPTEFSPGTRFYMWPDDRSVGWKWEKGWVWVWKRAQKDTNICWYVLETLPFYESNKVIAMCSTRRLADLLRRDIKDRRRPFEYKMKKKS